MGPMVKNVLDHLMKKDKGLEENERDRQWEGWLDSHLGWCEWKALASAHECAFIWLPKLEKLEKENTNHPMERGPRLSSSPNQFGISLKTMEQTRLQAKVTRLQADRTEAYDPNTDPSNPQKLFEKITKLEGFNVYKDQLEEEEELDLKMKEVEHQQPFLFHDLQRNPNDVQKRIVLYDKDQDEKTVETYVKAIKTINPKKATANFDQILVNFAKRSEESG
ncbi:uncharacterized protein MELLADRAFT_101602 [Melampsora larici-populina 98AG31]|uniref:Uncharacterized protein n=1 Tax=Melampsora larici-populina (strain 98AG31 / pathotype 3-4-7) TaxID=747676 RepID=F4R6D6_MELLP|nr:uncharacterized protein MELLADRAFT_101602 [Melampsora larici-populina 98AG31]EGG12479.1 hypothetical protein MELLADRAFT_101602 [Melampsora larici-populina 98AG31]